MPVYLVGGRVRGLHERSFVDDPTRALRAARYAARYGFELEPDTERLLRAADLGTVSRDRVEAELRKLAAEPRAREGFALLDAWGLVAVDAEALDLIERIGRLVDSEPWQGFAPRADAVLAAALGRGFDAAQELATARPDRASAAVEVARGRDAVTLLSARAIGAEWLDRYVTGRRGAAAGAGDCQGLRPWRSSGPSLQSRSSRSPATTTAAMRRRPNPPRAVAARGARRTPPPIRPTGCRTRARCRSSSTTRSSR